MTSLAVLLTSVVGQDDWGYDGISQWLNELIAPSVDMRIAAYTGGRGIIVRTPDGFKGDPNKKVLPGTFWSNDIFAPSQLYPSNGDPQCPSSTEDHGGDPCYEYPTGDNGPWDNAQIAYVLASDDVFAQMFYDSGNLQQSDWGWGVFYATDSNAADIRCRWLEDYQSYDCPDGWLSADGTYWTEDNYRWGAGDYEFGNPWAGLGGGGAGCHFGDYAFDQTYSDDGNGQMLVGDESCQCDYLFKDDWDHWVQWWISYGYYHGPMNSLDLAACWVNNFRDMIGLQNALYWRRAEWSDDSIPWANWDDSASARRPYWGWNEIPVPAAISSDPENWDTIMIKLPAEIERVNDMDYGHQLQLESDIDDWVNNRELIVPGESNAISRPGSYIVIAQELLQDDGINYQREFFCENWTSPNNLYRIVYSYGSCYVDFGAVANATAAV